MKKRVLSLFLVLAMCLTLLPTAAFAEGEDVTGDVVVQEQEPAAKSEPEPAPELEVADVQDDAEDSGEPEEAAVPQSGEEGTATVTKDSGDTVTTENCPHTKVTEANGKATCDNCGAQMVVRNGGTYYIDIADAINSAESGAVITLLADAETEQAIEIASADGSSPKDVTLNLAGHDLTCSGEFSIGLYGYLMPMGSGNINAEITVGPGGDLSLGLWTDGTLTSVVVESNGNFSPSDSSSTTIQELHYRGGTTHLGSGKYPAIINETGSALAIGDLLTLNYVFRDENGTLLKAATTIAAGESIRNLTVVDCTAHTDEDGDGHCDYCSQFIDVFPASVTAGSGKTTYYESLADAFTAARYGDTVTLRKDVDLEDSLIDTTLLPVEKLDLNGKTLSKSGSAGGCALQIGGRFTICDTSSEQTGKITSASGNAVYVSGGRLMVESGSFGSVYFQSGTAEISGGSFDSISTGLTGKPLGSLLAKGYGFADSTTGEIGKYYYETSAENVTVIAHTHSGVSCACGYTCPHDWSDKNGTCTVCGYVCPHDSVTEQDGKYTCDTCGTQFAAKVTDKGGNVTYYADGTNDKGNTVHGMFYALKNAPDGSTIKALTSGMYDVTITGGKTLTLDMNGTTNNGGSITLGVLEGQNTKADTGNTLILTGSGKFMSYVSGQTVYSTLILFPENTLVVDENWSGDLGQVRLYLAYGDSKEAKAQLSGGTFQSIGPQSWNAASTTAGSYLAEGYAFRHTDGEKAWVRYDTVLTTEYATAKDPLKNVEVVKCTTHIDSDGDARCDYCNRPASDFAASVTTKTGETSTVTYYDDFVEAFNAAHDNDTVTLLDTVNLAEGVTLNNDHAKGITLDLNDCSINGTSAEAVLKVTQDMTICDNGTNENVLGGIFNRYNGNENAIAVYLAGGHLTLKNGSPSTLKNDGYALYAVGGSLTIESIRTRNSIFIGSSCPVTINNGEFSGAVSIASPNAEISGGTFRSAFSVTAPGASISGGEFNYYDGIRFESGLRSISGGTFNMHTFVIKNSSKVISGGTFMCELENQSGTVEDLLADGYALKYISADGESEGNWLTEAEHALTQAWYVDVKQAPITSVSLTVDRETVTYGNTSVRFTTNSTTSSEGSVAMEWYLNDSSTSFAHTTSERPLMDRRFDYSDPVGTYKFRVVFTKDGYSKSTELTVTVVPADISSATVTPSAPTYNGQEQTPTVEVTLGGKALTAGTDYEVTVTPQKNAGSYTLTVTGKGNYTDEKAVRWSINQFEVTDPLMTLEYTTHVYTGEEIRPAVTVKDGETVIPASEYTVSYEDNTNAGTATVTVTNKAGGNYQVAEVSTSFTITRADASIAAAPAANTLTYNGGAQPLVTAGTAVGGTMMYSLAEDGEYAASIPTGKNAVTYTVWYKVAGDDNHNDTAPQSVTVTIAKAPVTVKAKNKSAYVGGTVPVLPAEPVKDTDYTVSGLFGADTLEGTVTLTYDGTPDMTKAGTATIKISGTLANDNYAITYADGTLTITTRPSSGGASSSGSTTTKTETTTNPDGSTTKTETKADGTVVETTTSTDGSTTRTETKADGSSVTESKTADGSTGTVKTDADGKTEADAKISTKAVEDAKKFGEAVKVPTEVKAGENSSSAPTVKIELPRNAGETKIEIPVEDVNSGTVAVIVHEDGTEEIVMDSLPTESGVQLTVDGNTTVKIIDNSKDFIDTDDHWAKDAIDFVSARGLVNGVSATMYAPDASTTRAQLWTILARQDGADLTGGATWYEKAQAWSMSSGISDGTDPNGTITRAQMVTMLWRAAGSPASQGGNAFADVAADSYYAQAVSWAVKHAITTGVGNGKFDPNGTCTRAQIAAFLMRSYQNR